MILNAVLLAFVALTCSANAAVSRSCQSVSVPPCALRINRDLLFLVDASDSLDPLRFQNEMLNYVQSLYCAFDPLDVNRAGLITFAKEILVRIPLEKYDQNTWFNKVDEVRAQALCCSCCTPTATAFQLARTTLQAVPIEDAFRIVFVITDGAPWQNTAGPFSWPGLASATYTWGTVFDQADMLKQMNPLRLRIMMVGVPNKDMVPPRIDYFQGQPDADKRPAGKPFYYQCQTRNGKVTCFTMQANRPIVSMPLDKNIFTTTSWDVQKLLDLTVGSACEILPTPAPTKAPTTLTPTNPPTFAPTMQPTNPPTFPPSKAPTKGPTNPPTFSPTKLPTFAPTFAPSRVPSMAPIKPELDGLDMYLLIDRSRSMKWRADLCRAAPGGNAQDADGVACWHLFLKFIGQIVTKTTQLPYRTTQKLGWKGSFPTILKRGVRVWMYAFACSGHQSEPLTITIGEKISTQAEFDAALVRAGQMLPDGGTCPGAAIERAAAMVQGNDLLTRIYKTAILFTDGVFYDMPRPRLAAKGLFHFGVLTYSMGISIPYDGNDYGLTPAEIKTQRVQLLNFVQKDETRLFNFGLEGLNLLDDIAQELADQLPYDAIKKFPDIAKAPYWCGWTSIARCEETDESQTNTGKFCVWNTQKNTCLPKTWCRYGSKLMCQNDPYCTWKNQRCAAKVQLA